MSKFVLGHDESLDAHDLPAEFSERDTDSWVEGEDSLEDAVGVLRDGED